MAKNKTRKNEPSGDVVHIFGPPPIITGERSKNYDELVLRTTSALKPADVIDQMLSDDIVRATWDIIRYHRLKNALINSTAHEALKRVIRPLIIAEGGPFSGFTGRQQYAIVVEDVPEELSLGWRANNPEARERVSLLLDRAAISLDEVMAEALSMKISEIAAIDSFIETAQYRRYSALEQLDRRHAIYAQKVRRFSADLEATEVRVLDVTASTGSEQHRDVASTKDQAA